MEERYEQLETAQIELLHQQVHDRLGGGEEDCDLIRSHHDSLAAELNKRGIVHNTEIICPEIETNAPHYQRGFTDDVCANCAFGQLRPYCNLYKFNYMPDFVCDSFRYYEVMELEPPHGFLMANGKQTAVAGAKQLNTGPAYIIVSNGEAFGVAILDEPAQVKTKEFEAETWQEQHRVTPRERRQWWPEAETFFVHRLKSWHPYEGVKLYEDGQIIDEPKLTGRQWKLISTAKELPKQIILLEDAVAVTEKQEFVIDLSAKCKELERILSATYQADVKEARSASEIIPLYSLALVRHPRMRVSKKNLSPEAAQKQEGEDMPYRIVERDDEYCVVKINADDTDGDIEGCHDSREEAQAQLTALNINVVAEEEDQASPVTGEPPRGETTFFERLKLAAKNILDIVTLAETEQEEDVKLFMNEVGIGQKVVNGELWHFTYSTNAFEDREGEIFSTKALESYVAENEANSEKGYFNLWHINAEDGNFNTDFARKEWQGVIGRFLVEAGPYLRDDKGRAARKFFKKFGDRHPEIAPEGWGCSPEFRYLPEERATGTYETIWITRTSTLPKMAAANIWTETRQMKHRSNIMALSEQQKKAAIEMFGDDFVSQMIQEAEAKTADLEQAGVAHKSETPKPEPEPQEQELVAQPGEIQLNMEELAAEVGKQFAADISPLADAITAMVASVKELQGRLDKLEEIKRVEDKTDVPRFVFNLKRASEAEETVVTDDDELKKQKPTETAAGSADSWSRMFNKK